MSKQNPSQPPANVRSPFSVDEIAQIATCACSHTLKEHAPDGCLVSECECTVAYSELIVGEIRAVDEL